MSLNQEIPIRVRSNQNGQGRPWPGGTVVYMIDKSYTPQQRQIMEKAFKLLSDQTTNCVRFVPRSNQKDYVYIKPGDGCNSAVGHQGGVQYMSLGKNCVEQHVVIHEATHALGFDHTFCRSDRDKYVKVLLQNCIDKYRFAFDKQRTNNELVPWDYHSVMMYGPKTFSKNQKPTMVPLDPKVRLLEDRERKQLSKFDIQMIRKLYHC